MAAFPPTNDYFPHLSKCAELVQRGPISQAEEECRAASIENPASPWPLIAITRCVDDDHPHEGAKALLQQAVQLAPNLAETHLALSTVLADKERREEVAAAQRLDPENLDIIFRLSNMAPDPNSAVMKRVAAIDTDYAAWHAAAAGYHMLDGAKDEVLKEVGKATSLEPDNPWLHYTLALLYNTAGDGEAELSELREAVRAAPDKLYWHDKLAFTMWAEDRQEPAIDAFRNLLKRFPDHPAASFRLVELLLKGNREDEAITELRRFIEVTAGAEVDSILGGWRLLSRKQLGDVLAHKGYFEAAADIFEAVLAERPDALTMNALGRIRLTQGRLDDAAGEFRRAIREDGANADFRYSLALCLARQNKLDDAIVEQRKALEIDPEYSDARLAISELLIHENHADGAIQELEEVLKTNPKHPDALNDLAWIHATRKDEDKRDPKTALRLATQAVATLDQTPGTPAARRAAFLDTLAEAMLINGRVAEALSIESSAAELDPGNPSWNERLDRFRKAAKSQRQ